MDLDYRGFVEEVGRRAPVEDLTDAARAVEATLETLGQRLPDPVKAELAGELPKDMADALNLRSHSEAFGADDFCTRVRALAQLDYPTAVATAGYTLAILRENLPEAVWLHVRGALTPDYRGLVAPETYIEST
jgi:uncharacterized protein (DUF2267 family)